MVAVAIGGAAVLGAGASIISGNKAAKAQQKGDAAAIAEQRRQYDLTRADYAPWRTAGASAVGALTRAYGLSPSLGSAGNTPGAAGTEGGIDSGAYGGFFASPGYAFRRDEGLKAIDRGAAARGILHSGASVKAEQRYGDGLAASEYDSYTARLAQLAGLGQSATAGTAAAGSSASNNISSASSRSGNARASSYANIGSSINSGLNNVMSAYLMGGMGGGGMFREDLLMPAAGPYGIEQVDAAGIINNYQRRAQPHPVMILQKQMEAATAKKRSRARFKGWCRTHTGTSPRQMRQEPRQQPAATAPQAPADPLAPLPEAPKAAPAPSQPHIPSGADREKLISR
jgi:hypothetical protein